MRRGLLFDLADREISKAKTLAKAQARSHLLQPTFDLRAYFQMIRIGHTCVPSDSTFDNLDALKVG